MSPRTRKQEVTGWNRKAGWNWPMFWLQTIKNSHSEGIIGWQMWVLMALNAIISFTFTTLVMLLLRDFVVHSSWYARLVILVVTYLNGLWIGRKSVHNLSGFNWKLVLMAGALTAFWMSGVFGFLNTLIGIS